MTRKLFWDDPYRVAASARITSVNGDVVTLDGTIFFAFAGGQERDHGTIGGHEVLDAQWVGPEISYRLDAAHGLVIGEVAHIVIDEVRRDRLRRLHMATEIVLELFTQQHPALLKIGAHMSPLRGRIDFASDTPIGDWLPAIQKAADTLIADDVEIMRAFEHGSSSRRYWEIAGFARVACGGTLPDRTGEIGPVALRRTNPGKGKERVEITFASAAE